MADYLNGVKHAEKLVHAHGYEVIRLTAKDELRKCVDQPAYSNGFYAYLNYYKSTFRNHRL